MTCLCRNIECTWSENRETRQSSEEAGIKQGPPYAQNTSQQVEHTQKRSTGGKSSQAHASASENMKIKWTEMFGFHPHECGWRIHRHPERYYRTPPGFIMNRVAPEDVGLWRSKGDVVFVITVCIRSISRGDTEAEKVLTKRMLLFVRHGLWVHFGCTMVTLGNATIQAIARDLPW